MPIDLNLEVHYYPLMVSLDRCNGSRNTLDDLSSKMLKQNVMLKTEDVKLKVKI